MKTRSKLAACDFYWQQSSELVKRWKVKFAQSCQIFHDTMDCSLWASSIHGVFYKAKIFGVGCVSSQRSLQPRMTQISCPAGRRHPILWPREAQIKDKTQEKSRTISARDRIQGRWTQGAVCKITGTNCGEEEEPIRGPLICVKVRGRLCTDLLIQCLSDTWILQKGE